MKPGVKFDDGKLRWDLLPIAPIEQIVAILTFGAAKYEPNNWQNIENGAERYYGSLMRHLAEWRKGDLWDGDSGLPHLAHAACCLIFMMWFEEDGMPNDDEFAELIRAAKARWGEQREGAGLS